MSLLKNLALLFGWVSDSFYDNWKVGYNHHFSTAGFELSLALCADPVSPIAGVVGKKNIKKWLQSWSSLCSIETRVRSLPVFKRASFEVHIISESGYHESLHEYCLLTSLRLATQICSGRTLRSLLDLKKLEKFSTQNIIEPRVSRTSGQLHFLEINLSLKLGISETCNKLFALQWLLLVCFWRISSFDRLNFLQLRNWIITEYSSSCKKEV